MYYRQPVSHAHTCACKCNKVNLTQGRADGRGVWSLIRSRRSSTTGWVKYEWWNVALWQSVLVIRLSRPFILPYLAVPHTAVEGAPIRWLFLTKPSDSKRRQFSKRKHADMSFITVRSLTSAISLLPCALYVPFVFLALWHARLPSGGCVSGTALPGSHANLALFSFIPSDTDRCKYTQSFFLFVFSLSLFATQNTQLHRKWANCMHVFPCDVIFHTVQTGATS